MKHPSVLWRLLSGTVILCTLLGIISATPVKAQGLQATVQVRLTKGSWADCDDGPFGGPPEIYYKVTIDGNTSSTRSDPIEVNLSPFGMNLTFSQDVAFSDGSSSIVIEQWDDDGGLTFDDDHCDIKNGSGKNLSLTVDLVTCMITGDLEGTCGEMISSGSPGWLEFDIVVEGPPDADGDGLFDLWETDGVDTDGDGTIDVDLPALGADPNHKDIFLELDWTAGNAPSRAAIQAMKAAFANAPIDAGTAVSSLCNPDCGVDAKANPDGTPGITLHVDTGGLTDATASEDGVTVNTCGDNIDNDVDGLADGADPDCLVGDNLGGGNLLNFAGQICNVNNNFTVAKQNNFNAARAFVFRYAISAQGCDLDGDGAIDSGGWGELGGNDFIEYNHDAGTIMHELGHTLNLRHGGNEDANCKPDYVSVMNYDLQFAIPQLGGGSIIDYSPPRYVGGRSIAPLVSITENNLSEALIFDAADPTNWFVYKDINNARIQSPLNGDIDNDGPGDGNGNGLGDGVDWNSDGDTNDNNLTVNVDTSAANGRPAACTNAATDSTLTGHDDWKNISLPFRHFGDSADGVFNPIDEPEPNLDDLLDGQEELNSTDLSITKSDNPDPAVAGEDIAYTIQVSNNGPNPAWDVQVRDSLPDGTAYASDTVGCVEGQTGEFTCDLGEMFIKDIKQFDITTQIAADLVYNAGSPVTIVNVASVENLMGPDADSSDNDVSEETLVVAVADLEFVDYIANGIPSQIIVGEPLEFSLSSVLRNNGPSSPMDVTLTRTSTAPDDSVITPAESTIVVEALAIDEDQTIDEPVTLQCNGYSNHTFSFQGEIQPSRPDDTDPEQSDNIAQKSFTIECVVPIQSEVKPRQISLNGNGVVPVTIFANDAGEYGLPLAFDPATIDSTSVRFGPRDLVWTDSGGAFEAHVDGHGGGNSGKRTYHFRTNETDLTSEDTEACIKGTWFDDEGDPHTFFGCTEVEVIEQGNGKIKSASFDAGDGEKNEIPIDALFLPLINR